MIKEFPTGNSHTKVKFDSQWRVLDVGSGHRPHPRANILVDRFLSEDSDRSGQSISIPAGKTLIIADGCALPFRDKAFDFVICSHVAEHVNDPKNLCSGLSRVAYRGYLETPSELAERLRPQPFHRWFVSFHNNVLVFKKKPQRAPSWFQTLFFSLYFYGVPAQLSGKKVFTFSYGCTGLLHYLFVNIRRVLVYTWLLLKTITYTRVLWEGQLKCIIR